MPHRAGSGWRYRLTGSWSRGPCTSRCRKREPLMSLPLKDLDDLTFDALVEDARALIPVYAPSWTDHNVSDPGITLLELFAWMTEQQVFRVNRIGQRERRKMLALLGGQVL